VFVCQALGGQQQFGQVLLDKAGVHIVRCKFRSRRQGAQQPQIGLHAGDAAFVQHPARAAHYIVKVAAAAADDQFRQQRVIVRRRRIAGIAVRIHPHAGAGRQVEVLQAAAGGARIALRIDSFCVDAQLHRIALRRRRRRRVQPAIGQRLSGRDAYLQLHQVDAADFLGHRMFYLQTGIGLDEHEGQVAGCFIHQEFKGAQTAVADAARERQRRASNALAKVVG